MHLFGSFSLAFCLAILVLVQSVACYMTYHLNETELNDREIVDRKVIVCRSAQEKRLLNILAKSYLQVSDVNAIKNVHTGYDLKSVEDQLAKWLTLDYLRLFINSSTVYLPLYSEYCVGIESSGSYRLTYHFNSFDFTNLALLITGTCLFYSAEYLSKKIFLFYASHMAVGVVGSILILALIAHRFLPRRLSAFFVFTSFYLNTYFVIKIKQYLFTYPVGLYLISYILVAAAISFAFAYYRGPTKNHRLFDLFKWILQSISILIIYFSSEIIEFVICIMVLILLGHNLSSFYRLAKLYRYYFPKQRKLLSEKEYEIEAQVETEKALEELRNYCKSPEFNKWKAIKKMHNASRFASFIDGEDHLSDAEVFEHISYVSMSESQWTDDETSSDESIGLED